MIRKILLLLLCLIVIVGIVEAKNSKQAKSQAVITPYKIWRTNVAPVIDGKMDKIWCTIPWIPISYYTVAGLATLDSEDYQGLTKAMWDDNNLYILFYSQAATILDAPTNSLWNQTADEVYIGATDSKAAAYTATDWQFQWPHWMQGVETAVGNPTKIWGGKIDSAGCEFKIRTDVSTTADTTAGLGGWWLEVKIPLENLSIPAVAGTVIGWDMGQDIVEDPTATGKQFQTGWWETDNGGWNKTDGWGEAILSPDVNIGAAKIFKTKEAIVIDGVKDAAYASSEDQDASYWRFVDGTTNDAPNPTAANVVLSSLYDDTNLYLFFDVNDNNITDVPLNPNWNQSAVEWYLGPDDKASPYSSLDQQYQIPNCLKGQETSVGNPTKIWGGKIDSTGCAFKVLDRADASGYSVEVQIPWENLNFGLPIDSGTVIGYLFQMDYSSNSTGRTGCAQWWDATNGNWNNSSTWGEAVLQGPNLSNSIHQNPTVANSFNLEQNYPNPFNPTTQITYSIPKSERVKLTVYNVLGNQVAVLVNQTQVAGTYTKSFSAQNLASGVYFYKLEMGSKMLAKKMMLIK